MRNASSDQVAKLLKIDVFELGMRMLEHGRCAVGEYTAVRSGQRPASR
jgi:hypothetical protein